MTISGRSRRPGPRGARTSPRRERGGDGAARPRRRASPAASDATTTSKPILIVEDDPAILDLLSELLRAEGYSVQTGMNGLEALRHVERELPALVVLDMRMPVMDGWAFARELKRRGLDLPIVVMTAGEDARRWAAEVGADAYLAKPFEVDELLRVVGRSTDGNGG